MRPVPLVWNICGALPNAKLVIINHNIVPIAPQSWRLQLAGNRSTTELNLDLFLAWYTRLEAPDHGYLYLCTQCSQPPYWHQAVCHTHLYNIEGSTWTKEPSPILKAPMFYSDPTGNVVHERFMTAHWAGFIYILLQDPEYKASYKGQWQLINWHRHGCWHGFLIMRWFLGRERVVTHISVFMYTLLEAVSSYM